ncbi:MAG: Do family serine endopeptidase [Sulfurimonas sp.]|uniref:Do family serine endopeptidase n=1 Tax=Sulfurimonas sp. TaxID=2022749 RepID=UPI0025DEC691|nr:Do family serine endopeptidase [Sulfurimonas sp.]MCK9491548.1 Do family serine endopeptidase [Sulfurimonas sp.]
MKKILLLCLLSLSLLNAKDGVNFKYADENTQRKNPTSQSFILSYNNVLKDIRTSVVNISTKKTITAQRGYQNPFFFEQPRVPQGTSGSGVVISKDGYIVTNNHVVDGADEIKVSLADSKKSYIAKLIGSDAKSDIAIIKIDAGELNAVTFYNSDNVRVGDVVFALGNPFGVGETITQGIVSATGRNGIGIVEYEDFIQTDASINPGNSGGALVNSAGHLIGINSAIISRSGGNDGIGLAIPSNMVTSIASQLIDNGKYTRAYLGVGIDDISEDMSSFYNNEYGALIISVEENSPAQKAGLKRGDLIISINGKKIQNASMLKNIIGSYQPSRVVNMKFLRDKKIDIVNVELGSLNKELSNANVNYKGLNVVSLPKETQKVLQNNTYISGGVLVDSVDTNSEAYNIGITKGDIIIQIEQTEIKDIDDFRSVTSSQEKKRFYIFRRGSVVATVL